MSLVSDVNGLSICMAHSLRKTPTCEGARRASLLAETPVVPTPYGGETDGAPAPPLRSAKVGRRIPLYPTCIGALESWAASGRGGLGASPLPTRRT